MRTRPCVVALLGAATLILCAARLPAQQPEPEGDVASLARPDSIRALREAKIALRAYYKTTVGPMARVFAPMMPIDFFCEEEVFPYCFGVRNGGVPPGSYGTLPIEFSTSKPRILEPMRKTFERVYRHYMRQLAESQARVPGDRWINGQRVFHLVERADLDGARLVAATCRAERWWCAMLTGYVAQMAEQYVRADSAMQVALRNMPENERCRWEDLSPLLEDQSGVERYRALSCTERRAVNDTLWWLADPLHSVAANERRSAHYVRHAYARLSRDYAEVTPPESLFTAAARRSGIGPAGVRGRVTPPAGDAPIASPLTECPLAVLRTDTEDSFRTVVVRMGIPTDMARNAMKCPLLIFRQPLYRFFPALDAVRTPTRAPAEAWNVMARRSNEYYQPRWGDFAALEHQTAYFRGEGSARLVAALDIRHNELLQRAGAVGAAVVLSAGPGDNAGIHRTPLPARPDVFLIAAPRDSMLLSLEAIGIGVGAARARFGAGPPAMPASGIALSDILVLDQPLSDVTVLDTAAAYAASHLRVPRGGSVGLYWETYGVGPADTVIFTLSVAERRLGSALWRMGQALGVLSPDSSQVEWADSRRAGGRITGQSVVLDLSGLAKGTHVIRLAARRAGGDRVTVSRVIDIVDP